MSIQNIQDNLIQDFSFFEDWTQKYEYMIELYKHHFNNEDTSIRAKIKKINNLISQHEEEISNPILEYISKRKDLKLIGKNKIVKKNRAPTISFISKEKKSKKVSEILVNEKIATRNDNFYAWRCLEALGIDTEDGVIRISLVHYNTEEEVDKLIKVLETIN